jgi:hypothetical protein
MSQAFLFVPSKIYFFTSYISRLLQTTDILSHPFFLQKSLSFRYSSRLCTCAHTRHVLPSLTLPSLALALVLPPSVSPCLSAINFLCLYALYLSLAHTSMLSLSRALFLTTSLSLGSLPVAFYLSLPLALSLCSLFPRFVQLYACDACVFKRPKACNACSDADVLSTSIV